jgi:uncharacterized protein YdhG (YjbR/CyaY superfamily)
VPVDVPLDVRGYIAAQAQDWQPALRCLRAACRKQLAGYAEVIAYGMPSYRRAGTIEVSFAKQARYLSLYVLNQAVMEAHRAQLAGLSMGKGCIRFRSPEQIDWAVVSDLLAETAASDAGICGP